MPLEVKHRPFQRLVYPGIVDEINALLFMEKKPSKNRRQMEFQGF